MPTGIAIGLRRAAAFALLMTLATATDALAVTKVVPADAIHHVGQTATVCGRVASAQVPHLGPHADIPEPRPAVPEPGLHGSDLGRGEAEVQRAYKGKAEIVVEDPGQIAVQP